MKQERPVDIFSTEFKADPYPFFAQLRATQPVYRTVLADRQAAWLITRYEDVAAVLKDERFVKNRQNARPATQSAKKGWLPSTFDVLQQNMLDLDAPDHTRLRQLVHKAFTPRLIESISQRVQTLADDLLDKVLTDGKGQMDLVASYALPIPLTIICEMLGIPATDQQKFHRWVKGMIAVSTNFDMLRSVPGILMMMRYLRGLVAERRHSPQEDLISLLVAVEADSDRLSADEVLAMIFLLIVAGHETTVNLIASGTLALLQFPAQLQKLRENPDLIRSAIEELLRFANPLETATERFTREPVTIAGVTIPRNERVFAVISSANRDEDFFPNADTLDITRENNRHLAFGQGVHYCMGAPLARLEGQIAITTLLQRLPDLKLAVAANTLSWRPGMVVRGLERLPVSF